MGRFEFSEGGSNKFWEVTQQGADYTVRFGRIDTDGQSKTTQCASPEEAEAEIAKLVREKLKKGYQEIGGQRNWRPPAVYDHHEHPRHFMNYVVSRFDPEAEADEGDDGEKGIRTLPVLRDPERRAYAIHTDYDDEAGVALRRLDALMADAKAPLLRALIVGNWFSDACDEPPAEFVGRIAKHSERLAGLVGLFAGDVVQEEAEISWLNQCDWAPAIHALPNLEEFVVRGGNGLRLEGLRHAKLRSLTIQSGGLGAETVRDVAGADLPELRNLTIWLGSDGYGADFTVEDLRPILDGKVFPKLEFLGLMNSETADELATAISGAAILDRLCGLDLSMGTLGDEGAKALLQTERIRKLKWLNLRHNFMSESVAREFKALGIEANVSDRQKADADDGQEYRFCEVSE